MKFSDVVAQTPVKQSLISLVKQRRMPHALMLVGNEGVGTMPMAIALARYLCCENRGDEDSCGVCPSCVKFNKLAHPDLHFAYPIVKNEQKKITVCDDVLSSFREEMVKNSYISLNDWLTVIADGKLGVIYAKEGDEIMRKLSYRPYESDCQVLIIWAPEKMNNECANHLLKFIEEPPNDTIIIFATDNEQEVLATINSRTQKVYLHQIASEDMVEKAREKYDSVDQEKLEEIARVSKGSWGRFMKELEYWEDKQIFFGNFMRMMRISWVLNVKEVKAWSTEMAGIGRDKQLIFLQQAQAQVRENFMMRVSDETLLYMSGEERAFANKFSRFIHENNIEDMMGELQTAEEQIEQNVSAKIIFFHLPFLLYKLIKRSND